MIHLYGHLAKKYPKINKIKVRSVSEAVRAMDANFPGFRHSIQRDRNYRVVRGDSLENGKDLCADEVMMKFSEDTWHILPLPMGAGGNGLYQVIGGAVLIVAGAVLTAYGQGAYGIPMMKLGAAIALSGIAQMLTPSPNVSDYTQREQDQRPSYIFNGPQNTVEPGLTIPVAYGETFIGSIFISGGVKIRDMVV
jgi:predicted phage tail protein